MMKRRLRIKRREVVLNFVDFIIVSHLANARSEDKR